MTESQYRARRSGNLPLVARPKIGGLALPSGKALAPDPSYALRAPSSTPCFWISDEPLSDVGMWLSHLARAFPKTGLWPLALTMFHDSLDRPWHAGELDPGSSTPPSGHDANAVLATWWKANAPAEGENAERLAALAPFGHAFPGLAPTSTPTKDSIELVKLVQSIDKGRLGLVSVTRPAEALFVLGWMGPINYFSDMGLLGAVLGSWEERFGAHLVAVGFDTIQLGVERPPTTLKDATALAAEHFAVCPDIIHQGAGSIEAYAPTLLRRHAWAFWWD